MKITMMTRWNKACGVSMHAELLGRVLVELGHDLRVLAPIESNYTDKDEPYVSRCYRLSRAESFFDPAPFLEDEADIFVVQNLEILPMKDLLKIYPMIRKKVRTVLVIHEGGPPKDPAFYRFEWDAIVCFDHRYKRFLSRIYPENLIKIIQYPCHPLTPGDKGKARERLGLPLDKKIIFNYGIGVYRHLHLLPTIKRVSKRYSLILLTITHVEDWFRLFEAVKSTYGFIELRRESLPIEQLYTYLHASDCLLLHKDSAEAVVVPSTAFLCLGAERPILAHRTNFFECFDKEVFKYRSLEGALVDVFEERPTVKFTLSKAREFVRKNSSTEIAKRFIRFLRTLMYEARRIRITPSKGDIKKGQMGGVERMIS